MTEVSLFDIARPFLWIAALAFVVGFGGFVILGGRSEAAYVQGAPAAWQASAPTPPPSSLRAV